MDRESAVEDSFLYQCFGELEDPRSTVNRKHLLVDVVAIAICGVVAGADGPDAISVWAKSKKSWWEEFLKLPHGLPSKDCIRRVLRALNPLGFQKCFRAWLEKLAGLGKLKFLGIDGKTLRGSHDKSAGLSVLHMVSVWSHEAKLTLAQVATEAKSNEITAIPELLELISLKGAVITIDAMGTQREIAAKIVDGGGDYILPTKGNQPGLEAAVKAAFEAAMEKELPSRQVNVIETEETAHGRKEKRTYLQMNVPKTFPKRGDWKGIQTLEMVIRTREINGEETSEVQYDISSIKRKCEDVRDRSARPLGNRKYLPLDAGYHVSRRREANASGKRPRERSLAPPLRAGPVETASRPKVDHRHETSQSWLGRKLPRRSSIRHNDVV